MDNLWLSAKVMSPYMLVVAILLTAVNFLNIHTNVAMLAGEEVSNTEVILSVIAMVLAVVAYIFCIRRLFMMFRRMSDEPYSFKGQGKRLVRHIGKFAGTMLLGTFIWVVLSIIAVLPMAIGQYAYFASVEGRYNFGDSALITDTGYAVIAIACVVCYYVIQMISVGNWATLMFLLGDIKSKNK